MRCVSCSQGCDISGPVIARTASEAWQDEAISRQDRARRDCFASLAMTGEADPGLQIAANKSSASSEKALGPVRYPVAHRYLIKGKARLFQNERRIACQEGIDRRDRVVPGPVGRGARC